MRTPAAPLAASRTPQPYRCTRRCAGSQSRARHARREDRIGSLAPGKLADIVIIDADALNLAPVHDPAATVVMQTSLANIEAVMIGGVWKKRGGRLVFNDLAKRRRELAQSGERLVREIEQQGRAA